MSPISLRVEVPEIKHVLQTEVDRRYGARDFAGHEGFAADWALVVEQDAVRGVDAIRRAVIHRDPVSIELGHAIWRARIKRRGFTLRGFSHLAEQLGGGGLVKTRLSLEAQDADGFEETQSAKRIGVGGVFRRLEADIDVALGGEIIDLRRLHLLYKTDQIRRVRHVAVMQEEPHIGLVWIDVKMIDPLAIER